MGKIGHCKKKQPTTQNMYGLSSGYTWTIEQNETCYAREIRGNVSLKAENTGA